MRPSQAIAEQPPFYRIVETSPLALQVGAALLVCLLAAGLIAWRLTAQPRARGRWSEAALDLLIRALHLAVFFVVPLAFSRLQQDPLLQKLLVVQFLVAPLLALVFLRALWLGVVRLPRTPYLVPMAAFAAWAGVGLAWTPTPSAAFDDWVHILCYVGLFWVTVVRAADRKARHELAFVALSAATCVAVVGLGQYYGFSFGGIVDPLRAGEAITGERARQSMASTIGHNLGTSGQAYFGLALALYLLACWRHRLMRLWLWAAATLHLVVLIRSQSRVYWVAVLALLVALPFLAWLLRPWPGGWLPRFSARAWAACLGAAVLTIAALSIQTSRNLPGLRDRLKDFRWETLRSTTQLRINVIGATMWWERPLLGMGLGGFKFHYPEYQGRYFERHPFSMLKPPTVYSQRAHNDVLQLAIEQGAVGLAILIWFGCAHLHTLRRLRRLSAAARAEAFLLALPVTGMFLVAVGYFPFHEPPAALHTVLTLALLAAAVGPRPAIASTGAFAAPRLRPRLVAAVALLAGATVCGNTALRIAPQLLADVHMKIAVKLAGDWGAELESPRAETRAAARRRLETVVLAMFDKGLQLMPYRGDLRWAKVQLLNKLLWYDMQTAGWIEAQRAHDAIAEAQQTLQYYRYGEVYHYIGQMQFLLASSVLRRVGIDAAAPLFADAAASVRKAVWTIPRHIAPMHFLGLIYWEAGREREAVHAWQRCLIDKDYLETYHLAPARESARVGGASPGNHGLALLRKAENTYLALLALTPERGVVYSELMRLYLDHADRLDPAGARARYIAELALERRKANPSLMASAVFDAYLALQDHPRLLQAFDLLAQDAFRRSEPLDWLLLLLVSSERYGGQTMAAELADRLEARMPRHQWLANHLKNGARLQRRAGRLARALEWEADARRKNPAVVTISPQAVQDLLEAPARAADWQAAHAPSRSRP